ncbi:MAG: hypothetical protein AAFR59_12470 [Bacteroidota bacterium]
MSGIAFWLIISATGFQSPTVDMTTYYKIDSPDWKIVNHGLVKVWIPDSILPVTQFTGHRSSPGSYRAKYQDPSGNFFVNMEHLQTQVARADLTIVQDKMAQNLREKEGVEIMEQRIVTQRGLSKIYFRLYKFDLLRSTYTELSISTIQGRLFILSCTYTGDQDEQWKPIALKVLASWKEA